MLRLIFVFSILFTLNGCSMITLVENQRQTVGGIFSIDPQANWNRFKDGSIETWTMDGPLLQSIRFIDSVGNGESIFKKRHPKQKLPIFRNGMTPTEIQELVVDTLASLGSAGVESNNVRPIIVGSLSGFRFELKFLSTEGLEQDGLVVGVTSNKKLYLLMYTGDRSYYYPKHIQQVEEMIRSIQTII